METDPPVDAAGGVRVPAAMPASAAYAGHANGFTVNGLRPFDKDAFPTRLVYGGDLSTPTLRLIACRSFDPSIVHHTGNLVVFSQPTDARNP